MAKRAKYSNLTEDTTPKLHVMRTQHLKDLSIAVRSKSLNWSNLDGHDRVRVLLNYIQQNSLQSKFSQVTHLSLSNFNREFIENYTLLCNIHPERAFTSLFEWSSDPESIYSSAFWSQELVKFCSFLTATYTMDKNDTSHYSSIINLFS